MTKHCDIACIRSFLRQSPVLGSLPLGFRVLGFSRATLNPKTTTCTHTPVMVERAREREGAVLQQGTAVVMHSLHQHFATMENPVPVLGGGDVSGLCGMIWCLGWTDVSRGPFSRPNTRQHTMPRPYRGRHASHSCHSLCCVGACERACGSGNDSC